LSLIYSLRTFDFDASDSSRLTSSAAASEMAIAVSDDIRLYGIENHGLESIKVGGEQYQAIKYKIQTDEKKDNHYFVWLKNDRKKTPLRLAMDAPLGKLTIDLVKVTQIDVREQKALLERPVIVAERTTSR
jgi:hypothetical protein